MYIISVTSSMFVPVKKGDNPNLRRMKMKLQKDTTKKSNNFPKSEADLLHTVWYTHVALKTTKPLFILFSLAVFAVYTRYLNLPLLPCIFLT